MKNRVKELREQGDHLFNKRGPLESSWQEIAEHFYYERADFTSNRSLGSEYSQYSMSSVPAMHRRELGNLVQSMLRPDDEQWFLPSVGWADTTAKPEVKRVTDYIGTVMKRAMYDRTAGLDRATKIIDHDFITFGQGVMTSELDKEKNSLLFRDWHLRDVAWADDYHGMISVIHHKKREYARDLVKQYPKTVDPKVTAIAEKMPFQEINCRYICIPAGEYDQSSLNGKKPKNAEYAVIYVDCDNETILKEGWLKRHNYIIPRWQRHGSQYASSPAIVIAFPDAKLLWGMVETLYRAGEKAVDPPMIAVQELMRSDIGIGPGDVSYVDAEFDGKLREVLQTMQIDASGLRFGAGLVEKQEQIIMKAFYLDRVNLPPMGPGMTATEVRARTEEYIRTSRPLFTPMATEYNGQICENVFNLMLDENAFGDPREWPKEMLGEEIHWQFEGPLTKAERRQDAAVLQEVVALLGAVMPLDQTVVHDLDARKAFRKAAAGLGAKGDWLVSEDEAAAKAAAQQEQQAMQQNIAQLGQGAEAAKNLGQAANQFEMAAA